MKISELQGERALDVFAEIMEPAAEILADKEFVSIIQSNQPKVKAVKVAIKNHKKAIIEILAALDGEDPATYKVGLLTLPVKLLEILNDPDIENLFSQQGQTLTSSTSAMENTEENEQ